MAKEIVLTPEELEDLKDEIKFREKVYLKLKQLNGIPEKVWRLETKVSVLMWGLPLILIVAGLVYKAFMR